MKLIIKVSCLPEADNKVMRGLYDSILESAKLAKVLEIQNENDVAILFPADKLKRPEIIIEVEQGDITQQRLIACRVFTMIISGIVREHFPKKMIRYSHDKSPWQTLRENVQN